MLIAGFLRKDFIENSFKLPKEDLKNLLLSLKNNDYIFLIKDPSIKSANIFTPNTSKDYQTRIDLWIQTILDIKRKGRYIKDINNKIIIAAKPKEQGNSKNFTDKDLYFYIKALTGKIWNFSNLETKDNDYLHDIKCFSSSLFSFSPKLTDKISENNKTYSLENKNINKDKKVDVYHNLFFEKIAGYLCFNDTIIIFDQYIYEPTFDANEKPTKISVIRFAKYLSKTPNLKNLIILAPDWWNNYKLDEMYQNNNSKKIKPKKMVIDTYLNSIYHEFNKNKKPISINFYLIPTSVFKNEHERYLAFTNLKRKCDEFDLKDLANKNGFISIQLGQGIDYFNDIPNNKANIKYSSSADFKNLINTIIENKIDTYKDKKFINNCKEYWEKVYGIKNKLWIHQNELL